ncbi:GNAT family N-acetyltransferase [Staphylococcus coagulans]|uniref:GNAT family N-acetyltransferase n=1 Tax=Staphylococcus coagulans TaxID=74706 RepID=UPI001BEC1A66|nr:GNAT family N-acetyltransferase [Staphylococcus coagulans]MBT2813505.1 GNAT family N-acetyltransferase [Staphylococcus coagulans]MBT2815768.1 GNAT family N-acetyltransferase [Staphylococcus coagulans]MBT2836843.1 GNAT family N-acetyltransferase [Staphylococcus coagulans]MBT2841371.1 GNAT family N-acetyltransferase [Staphylococcus coagulans]MBT2847730.1 GNAT family N-acetyltransferase [Staphylococcus coagulans]
MIRKATYEDVHAIAELTYMIWQDMELEIVQRYAKSTVIHALMKSITDVHYRNALAHVHVYEENQQVAGMIVAYPGKNEAQYEKEWERLQFDTPIELKHTTPLPVLEADEGDIYIESIATFPEFRGRGIARQLMRYLLSSDNHATWGLNCEYINEKAYQLYRKMGFETVKDKMLYDHRYRYMKYKGGNKIDA